jgi:hypothetical protein
MIGRGGCGAAWLHFSLQFDAWHARSILDLDEKFSEFELGMDYTMKSFP